MACNGAPHIETRTDTKGIIWLVGNGVAVAISNEMTAQAALDAAVERWERKIDELAAGVVRC